MPLVHSLRLRLLLVLVFVALVPVGTAAFLLDRATEHAFHAYNEARTRADAATLAAQIDQFTGVQTIVVDGNNQVVGGAVGPGTAAGSVTSFTAPPAGSIGGEATTQDESGASIGGMAGGAPAEGAGAASGFAVTLPGLPDKQFLHAMDRALLIAVALATLAAVLLAALLSRRVVRPVETLTDAARGMAAGDVGRRVAVQSQDELGMLARAFNTMADRRARLEELRRSLVNDVAHELRTPLANLQGYLEILRDGLAPPTPETIAVLHEESLLLSRLVSDLQELALAEAGELPLSPEPIDLADSVANALGAFRPQADAKGVALATALPDELPAILVDAARLSQILRNLLRNAILHTPPGGSIEISAIVGRNEVSVSVRDTGSGIPPEHLPNVFDRFYRADPARARATGGSGLGLAIVKHLVEAHGGRIEVESTVGIGTTFTLTLPVACTAAPVPEAALLAVSH